MTLTDYATYILIQIYLSFFNTVYAFTVNVAQTESFSVLTTRERAMVRRLILLKLFNGWNKGVRLQKVRDNNVRAVLSR